MRSTFTSAAALLSAISLASAQTFTDCDPTKKTCPADKAIGAAGLTTDFTKVSGTDAPSGWSYADGTSISYDSADGAKFVINSKTGAPTVSTEGYIMFGKVTATIKASAGTGIVSSFILESDDLDEIDWEWLGSTDHNVESNFFGKGDTSTYDRAEYHEVPDQKVIENWHKYTIDWNKDAVKWYIDDNLVRTLTYDDPKTHNGNNYPQTPMKIKMGNWVGCPDINDAALKGTCEWAGGQAVFPGTYTMLVKDVTIEDYGCGTEYTYGDMTGSYTSIKGTSSDCSSSSGGSSGSSSSGSSSSSKSSSSSSSSATKSGGVFAGTSTSSSSSSKATDSSSSASGSAAEASTTLSTTTTAAGVSTTNSASSTGSTPASATNAAGKPSKFGKIEMAAIGLGLGIGYLVM